MKTLNMVQAYSNNFWGWRSVCRSCGKLGFVFRGALMDTTNHKSYNNIAKEEVSGEESKCLYESWEPRQFIVQMWVPYVQLSIWSLLCGGIVS